MINNVINSYLENINSIYIELYKIYIYIYIYIYD